MNWTCVQIEERLSDYLDGLLPAAEQREFRAHVDACPQCAPLLAQVTHVIGRLRTLEPEPVPAALFSTILDQTLGPRKTKREWFGWLPMLWQPRFAMGTVTVLATLLIIFQATGVRRSDITAASLNPVNIFHAADRHAHLAFARSVKFVNDLRVVYEIQSRLQPAGNPAPNSSEPSSAPPQKSPNESQRNNGTNENTAFVATLLPDAPTRSPR
ncbi:MAG TPA: anti-sigma factor [Candidatus Acidoferrales bacterium]|nr:anti-sigma factor [Candidatus Acidoferrales bacterium]